MHNIYIVMAIRAAIEAGKVILPYYHQRNFDIETKSDASPVTAADRAADEIIREWLAESKLPILSEESEIVSHSERKEWKYFWCVDPLDGTKEFISGRKDFTVNIALMNEKSPIGGVIYLPAEDTIYYGLNGEGAFKTVSCLGKSTEEIINQSVALPDSKTARFTVVGSHSHFDIETQKHIDEISALYGEGKSQLLSRGSSVKFCLMAEGNADYYPRKGTIMEWDMAAGHAICEASGCRVSDWNGEPLKYYKPDLRMPAFKISRLSR